MATMKIANVVQSPGSTLAGIAAMAPEIVHIISTLSIPANPAGWITLVFGILALFAGETNSNA